MDRLSVKDIGIVICHKITISDKYIATEIKESRLNNLMSGISDLNFIDTVIVDVGSNLSSDYGANKVIKVSDPNMRLSDAYLVGKENLNTKAKFVIYIKSTDIFIPNNLLTFIEEFNAQYSIAKDDYYLGNTMFDLTAIVGSENSIIFGYNSPNTTYSSLSESIINNRCEVESAYGGITDIDELLRIIVDDPNDEGEVINDNILVDFVELTEDTMFILNGPEICPIHDSEWNDLISFVEKNRLNVYDGEDIDGLVHESALILRNIIISNHFVNTIDDLDKRIDEDPHKDYWYYNILGFTVSSPNPNQRNNGNNNNNNKRVKVVSSHNDTHHQSNVREDVNGPDRIDNNPDMSVDTGNDTSEVDEYLMNNPIDLSNINIKNFNIEEIIPDRILNKLSDDMIKYISNLILSSAKDYQDSVGITAEE